MPRGRPARIAREPYVLTHIEVARDYFRASPASMTPQRIAEEHPNFPKPDRAGHYHRGAVEAWFDIRHGVSAKSLAPDPSELAMEALRGRRRPQAFS